MAKRILVVDDEEMILNAIKLILEDMGLAVDISSDPAAGERMALERDYDLVLVDLRMPGRSGAEVASSVLAKKPACRILVITAFPGDPLAARALEAGCVGLLKKPFEIAKILEFLGP
jgi:DNA-binding response OmpR family regulator